MIIKITLDREKAKSILKMAENIENMLKEIIKKLGKMEDQSIIVREYYEVIRELITALLLSDGFKAIGEYAHKETIDYLSNYKEFSQDEVMTIQDLRTKRNKSSYEGRPIKSPYLENKKEKLDLIINKLKFILRKRLK
ncbi:MAG: hypothetical protein IB618_03825 [Candidatus Pacearchaeota archaeon]|nr:MAG: hypothetical protein IB618_03825 [Candidatus Pacearchaeota archaeon]